MTDIAVIMSKPMVQATLREIAAPGTGKTETRRAAWLEEPRPHYPGQPSPWQKVKPGDRLWVKEAIGFTADHMSFFYEADKVALSDYRISLLRKSEVERGKPYVNLGARYIPQFASRITLIVTTTKMERLWAISEKSCDAEGIVFETADPPFWYVPGLDHAITGVGIEERADLMPHPVQCFRKLWIYLHGRDAWDANPEVVAVSFKPFLCNIDAMPRSEAA